MKKLIVLVAAVALVLPLAAVSAPPSEAAFSM
jgi:hypothetical protein